MTLLLRRLASLALVLALALSSAPALRAQDGDPAEMQKLDEVYQRANEAISAKNYEAAIAAYDELFKLLADAKLDAEVKQSVESSCRYNLACAYALTGKKAEALAAFDRAVELGFDDWDHVAEDTDLDSIRNEEGFKKSLEKGKELAGKRAEGEAKKAAEEATAALAKEPLFAFDFEVTTLEGAKLKLSDLKGKVVIVDFWGTWCPPCRKEIPHFVKLYAAYKEKGLEIVGLAAEQVQDLGEAAKLVKEFAEKAGIKYPLAAIGQDDAALQAVPDLEGFPTTLWIDREGKVRLMKVGYHDYGPIEGYTKPLLEAGAK